MSDADPLDVFISYARADKSLVELLIPVLVERRWSVWWDAVLQSGEDFGPLIEARVRKARCVFVLWSEHSRTSVWVRAEAEIGRARGVLVQAVLGEASPPLPFNTLHFRRLAQSRPDESEIHGILEDVAGRLRSHEQEGGTPDGELLPSWRQPELSGKPKRSRTIVRNAIVAVATIGTLTTASLVIARLARISPNPARERSSNASFRAPQTTWAGDNAEDYVDSVTLDKETAQLPENVNAGQGSPEAAVTHFYSSLIRRDKRYREVLPGFQHTKADIPPDVLRGKLQEYEKWKFWAVKLMGRSKQGDDEYYVRVFLDVEFQGKRDSGTDTVTVQKFDGGWFVVRPPT